MFEEIAEILAEQLGISKDKIKLACKLHSFAAEP